VRRGPSVNATLLIGPGASFLLGQPAPHARHGKRRRARIVQALAPHGTRRTDRPGDRGRHHVTAEPQPRIFPATRGMLRPTGHRSPRRNCLLLPDGSSPTPGVTSLRGPTRTTTTTALVRRAPTMLVAPERGRPRLRHLADHRSRRVKEPSRHRSVSARTSADDDRSPGRLGRVVGGPFPDPGRVAPRTPHATDDRVKSSCERRPHVS